jgi:hypothetical protein
MKKKKELLQIKTMLKKKFIEWNEDEKENYIDKDSLRDDK